MPRNVLFLIALGFAATGVVAAENEPEQPKVPETIKSPFLVTGLHCPPCASTVEKSVKSIKGVRTVKVDWQTKNAKIEFDEKEISSQQLANRIAATQHMMGGNMKYGSWLALSVPEVDAAGNADKAKAALSKIKGVSNVAIYVPRKSVGVAFTAEGKLSSVDLIAALKEAGIESTALP